MQLLAPGSSKADVDGRPELVSPLRCSLVARGAAALTHSVQLHETTPFARTHTYSRVLRNTASTGEFSLAHNTRPHMHPPTDTDAPTSNARTAFGRRSLRL